MSYRFDGHSFKSDGLVSKIVGRAVCSGCGLIRLKNRLTDWCVARGCNYDEHPDYRRMLRELPRLEREERRA